MHYQPWLVDDPTLIPPLPPPNLYRTSAPPHSATSPSSSPPSPSRSPIRPTLPLISSKGYKRPRTMSQGRPSRSFVFCLHSSAFHSSFYKVQRQSSSSIPISWASRPVDHRRSNNKRSVRNNNISLTAPVVWEGNISKLDGKRWWMIFRRVICTRWISDCEGKVIKGALLEKSPLDSSNIDIAFSPLWTISVGQCIMWHSTLSPMWIQCTSCTWGDR